MKLKTAAVLAASGLMAVSLAYLNPAFAQENTTTAGDAQQQTGAMPMQPAPSAEPNTASNENNAVNNTAENSNAANNPAGAAEQGQPDVASGDDDY